MATFIGTAAANTITPAFVSAGVGRFPVGSFPGAGADVIFGGGGNDTMDGGGGNDTIVGDAGNDTLRGNSGADVLIGGADIDTATYSEFAAGVTVSLVAGVVGVGGNAAGDTLFEIENLIGSNFNDSLTGDGLANVLNSGNGNDILRGGGGADVLIGGGGIDTATYFDSAVGVIVSLLPGVVGVGGTAAGDTLSQIENLTGSNFNDSLNGDVVANTLNGGFGNDVLRGNAGADVLIGGFGTDTATYSESGAGVTVSLVAGVVGVGGNAAGDTLSQIENLTGSNFNDSLTGDGLANSLNGGRGDDTLDGGAGNDFLYGSVGFDTLIGNLGNDTFDYNFIAESTPGFGFHDHITDFAGNGAAAGDVIDLSGIDADGAGGVNGAFNFIFGAAFTAGVNGELRYDTASGLLQGCTNGSGVADFEIHLTNAAPLFVGGAGTDIIL